MLDGDLAQRVGRRDASGTAGGGEHGELRDQDAHAEGGHERDRRMRRRERRPDLAAVGEEGDDDVRERTAGGEPERAGDQRHEQRFTGDQPADLLRRRTECAQHGGLAPALGDRERERPGDDEQRDRTGDAAEGAEDGDEAGAVRCGRVAGVGIGRVARIKDLDPAAQAFLQVTAQCGGRRPVLGDHADGVDLPGGAGQCAGDRGCEEHRGLALVARPASVGDPRHAVARVTGRSDDAHHRAHLRAEPGVGDDVARAGRRASGGEVIRREGGTVPAVTDEPVRVLGVQPATASVPGTGRERKVADGVGDAGDGHDPLDGVARKSRARDDVDALGVLAVPDGDGRVGAHDGVRAGKAPFAR